MLSSKEDRSNAKLCDCYNVAGEIIDISFLRVIKIVFNSIHEFLLSLISHISQYPALDANTTNKILYSLFERRRHVGEQLDQHNTVWRINT